MPLPTFAEKLDRLFELVTRPDGQPFGHTEVATGAGVTAAYVWRLRRGREWATVLALST
jgi:hypothetical protein